MAEDGMDASVSDAGVAALCARAAVRGAYLNVMINAAELNDQAKKQDFLSRGAEIERQAAEAEESIMDLVRKKLAS